MRKYYESYEDQINRAIKNEKINNLIDELLILTGKVQDFSFQFNPTKKYEYYNNNKIAKHNQHIFLEFTKYIKKLQVRMNQQEKTANPHSYKIKLICGNIAKEISQILWR